MAEIHDKRDQLIHVLAGLQATVWIGLFSLGFWPGQDCWKSLFWMAMVVCTSAMVWQLVVLFSCYYYFRASENEKRRDLTEDKRISWSVKSNFWRFFWNSSMLAFIIGMVASVASGIARFMG